MVGQAPSKGTATNNLIEDSILLEFLSSLSPQMKNSKGDSPLPPKKLKVNPDGKKPPHHWTVTEKTDFLDLYTEVCQDKELTADDRQKNLKPKGWVVLATRMQKVHPHLDEERCKYLWNSVLKPGWAAWEWCEGKGMLSGDGAREETESWTQYFLRRKADTMLPSETLPIIDSFLTV